LYSEAWPRGAGVNGAGVGFAPTDCVATGLASAGGGSLCFWRKKKYPRPAMIRKIRNARILQFGAVAKPLGIRSTSGSPLSCGPDILRNAVIELLQKSDAFTACFAKKFAAVCADGTEAMPMINPCDLRGCFEQNLKLQIPSCALNRKQSRLKIAQPVGVKINMLRFVFQNECANFLEHAIVRLPVKQTIVGRSDQLGDDEDLNFKFETERAPGQPEDRLSPVMSNGHSAEPMHQSFEQARVFLFFSDEKPKGLVIGGVV
jgi:hypothetical protein